MSPKAIQNSIIAISLITFAISLTQTAVITNESESAISYFCIGGFLIGFSEWFIWLANPLYLLSIILFKKNNKMAILSGVTATGLSASFSLWNVIKATNEAGTIIPIKSFEAGYYLWTASISTLTLGILYYFLVVTKQKSLSDKA
jgi:hypothetical protein